MTYLPLHRGASWPALAFALLAWPAGSRAAVLESDLVIDSEWQLYDLHERGVLSRWSLEALSALLRSGVDLGATAVPPSDERLRHLAAFLQQRHPPPAPVGGSLEVASHYTAGDPVAPPAMLRVRLNLPHRFSIGVAIVSTRQRLGTVSWDPARHALLVRAPHYSVNVPKFFLSWEGERLSLVAGTFRIGFAERLTLDNTRRQSPNGFHADDAIDRSTALSRFCPPSMPDAEGDLCGASDEAARYVSGDFGWQEGFRGLAASVRDIWLPAGARIQLHAFASYQTRSVYQYELFDPNVCADPRGDDGLCRAPPVFDAESGRKVTHATLADAFDESSAGGNASLSFAGGARLGVTGYVAAPRWRVAGPPLDYQESATFPRGGPFGAVGINFLARAGTWQLSAEGARSFDRLPGGGGGFGAVQRSVLKTEDRELELILRYFDARFVNPHARPLSAPDEMEGQSARNEAGVRVRYWHRPGVHWRLAGSAEVWGAPEAHRATPPVATPKIVISARGDFASAGPISVAAWASHARAPLPFIQRAQEVGATGPQDSAGWGAERSRAGARFALMPIGPLAELSIQGTYGIGGDEGQAAPRPELTLWAEAIAEPTSSLRLRLLTRYRDDKLGEVHSPHRSWATSLEAGWAPGRSLFARSRYEANVWLGTSARVPNPEHRFRLELETRF